MKIIPKRSLVREITTSTTGLALCCKLNASNLHSKWGNWISLPIFATALKSLNTIAESIFWKSPYPEVCICKQSRVLCNGLNRKSKLWESLCCFHNLVYESAARNTTGSTTVKLQQEHKSKNHYAVSTVTIQNLRMERLYLQPVKISQTMRIRVARFTELKHAAIAALQRTRDVNSVSPKTARGNCENHTCRCEEERKVMKCENDYTQGTAFTRHVFELYEV